MQRMSQLPAFRATGPEWRYEFQYMSEIIIISTSLFKQGYVIENTENRNT